MIEPGIGIALLTALSWSIGIFPFTEAARRLGTNSLNHFRLLVAVVVLTPLVIIISNTSFVSLFNSPMHEQWIWMGFSGVVGLTLGDHFGFTSFAILGPRIASVFNTLAPGAAFLFSFLLLGEHVNVVGVVGMLITILGVAWVSLSKKGKSQIRISAGMQSSSKGVVFAILAALCQGIGLVMSKKGMMPYEGEKLFPLHAAWMRMLIAASSLYFVTLISNRWGLVLKPLLKNEGGGIKFALIGSLFGPIMGVSLSMMAVSMINVSVAQTLFSLVPVLAIPLNYLFYKEKITISSVIGAAIAVLGVFVLIWREYIQTLLNI